MLSRPIALTLTLAALLLGSMQATAAAEMLVDQPPGPSGIAVRADDGSGWHKAFDDFNVPVGAHWHPEAIQVFGQAASEHARTFEVKIFWSGGATIPLEPPDQGVFRERVTVAGGPNYLIPIEGAPRLDHEHNYVSGLYWISVQAVGTEGQDEWSWLTGPDTPGTAPAYFNRSEAPTAEPGLAFQLLGTSTEVVEASSYGAGLLVSSPPGISCPPTCATEFPRGTSLTFTATATKPSWRFTEWGFRNTGFMGPPGALVPVQIPSPCGGAAGCTFTLDHDSKVGAVFDPIDEVTVLRVVRHPRLGRADLLVWAPGEGVLSMYCPKLRTYWSRRVPAGLVRIPLIPTKPTAKTLRRNGHVAVSATVYFRPIEVAGPGTTQVPVTLVRKH